MYEWVTTEFWTHEYIYIHIHTMMMTQMHGLIRTMANMHEGSERWGRGRKKVSPQRCNKLKVISHDKRFSRLLPLTRIILPKKTTNNSGNTFNGWDQKQTLTSFIWLEVASLSPVVSVLGIAAVDVTNHKFRRKNRVCFPTSGNLVLNHVTQRFWPSFPFSRIVAHQLLLCKLSFEKECCTIYPSSNELPPSPEWKYPLKQVVFWLDSFLELWPFLVSMWDDN